MPIEMNWIFCLHKSWRTSAMIRICITPHRQVLIHACSSLNVVRMYWQLIGFCENLEYIHLRVWYVLTPITPADDLTEGTMTGTIINTTCGLVVGWKIKASYIRHQKMCKTQLEKPPRDSTSPFISTVVFIETTKTMGFPGIANTIWLHEQISKKSYIRLSFFHG